MNGFAWAKPFDERCAAHGERLKKEGDGRTPGGLFWVGEPFGSGPSLPPYVGLEPGRHFCVDDPLSPEYDHIVLRLPPGTKGEDIAASRLYRRGLLVKYNGDRNTKSGSCIFIHVWSSERGRTLGCVALAEHDVADLQKRAAIGPTILAILPGPKAGDLLKYIKLK